MGKKGGGVEDVTYLVYTTEEGNLFLLLLEREEVYCANTALGNYNIIKKH